MAEPSDQKPFSPAGGDDTGLAAEPQVRCVLVCAGGRPPCALTDALAAKHVEIVEARGVFDALASVLGSGEARSMHGRGWSVVVVEPERVARSEELFRALGVFAPGCARWVYDESASPALRGHKPANGEAAHVERAPRKPRRVNEPKLRLSAPGDEAQAPDDGEPSPVETLTSEELEMLLDGPGEG